MLSTAMVMVVEEVAWLHTFSKLLKGGVLLALKHSELLGLVLSVTPRVQRLDGPLGELIAGFVSSKNIVCD
jgi:hypothetical protein